MRPSEWLGQLRKRLRGRIIRNLFYLLGGTLAAHIAVTINFAILARQLGLVQYGQFAASATLLSVLSIAFSLGLDTWVLREGGRNPAELPAHLGSVGALKVALGGVWLVALHALVPWLDANTFPPRILSLMSLVVWMDSLLLTALSGFKAALQNQTTVMLEAGSDWLTLLATLGLAALGTTDAIMYLGARLIVLVTSLAAAGWCVVVVLGVPRPQLRRESGLRWRTIFSFSVSDLLAWATMRLDVLIVAVILGPTAVGLYAPAVTIINSFFIFPNVGYTVMIPVLSRLFAADASQAWAMSWRSVSGQALTGLVLSASLLGTAPIAHWVLGLEYASLVLLLQLLSPLLFFKALSFGWATILVALGRQTRRAMVQFINVLLIVGLDLAAAYLWGIVGVALVFVMIEVFICVGYGLAVYSSSRRFLAFRSVESDGLW